MKLGWPQWWNSSANSEAGQGDEQAVVDQNVESDSHVPVSSKVYIERRVQLGVHEAISNAGQRAETIRHGVDEKLQSLRADYRETLEGRVQLGVSQAIAYAENRTEEISKDVRDLRYHLPNFLNAVATVPALAHQIAGMAAVGDAVSQQLRTLEERCSQLDVMVNDIKAAQTGASDRVAMTAAEVQALSRESVAASSDRGNLWKSAEAATRGIGELWQRVEFVRKEIMYELRYGGAREDASRNPITQRIVDEEKVEQARQSNDLRLNIGCGHVPLPGYVNVDLRALPGVDIVAEVGKLPFEPATVKEIASFHTLEHFPQEELRRLLKYWFGLLKPGGVFRAVVPDGEAMLTNFAAGTYPFEHFRMVLFGGQEYEGDFHYNLLTPATLTEELRSVGFEKIAVPVKGRKNDISFEFEITAMVP